MNDQQLKTQLESRELMLREIFPESFRLLTGRLSFYILLTMIIYIPANILVELLVTELPEEMALDQYTRILVIQAAVSIYSMIGVSVTTILVRDQLNEKEDLRFLPCFSEGIRTWPYFLITMIVFMGVVILGLSVIVLVSSAIPLLFVPAITLMLVVSVLAVLALYGSCIMAALHRTMLKKNLDQVNSVLKNHIGKSLGLMLLLTIVSMAVALPVMNLSSSIALLTGSRITGIILNVIVETVLSILNVYMNIAMVLRFMNLEKIRG